MALSDASVHNILYQIDNDASVQNMDLVLVLTDFPPIPSISKIFPPFRGVE